MAIYIAMIEKPEAKIQFFETDDDILEGAPCYQGAQKFSGFRIHYY